ncbi:hypothetical protein QAD02_004676, partial [Eretmocerus hayati]
DDNISIDDDPEISLENGNRTLKIKDLSAQRTGKYVCTAENGYGYNHLYQYVTLKTSSSNVEGRGGISAVFFEKSFILLLILVVFVMYFNARKLQKMANEKDIANDILMNFEEAATVSINPELSISEQAEFLPYDRKWEFPRDRIVLGKTLGSGAFGVVVKAKALGIVTDQEITTVAVKMVHKGAEPIHLRALASELKILVHLGKHLNIVNLLGACTDNIDRRELLVIVEYCCFGNLRSFLLRHREAFRIQMGSVSRNPSNFGEGIELHRVKSSSAKATEGSGPSPISVENLFTSDSGVELPCVSPSLEDQKNRSSEGTDSNCDSSQTQKTDKGSLQAVCIQDLLSWAFQVARGMEYLSQKKVLHGDLAARNILLAKDKVVKICDFGLAKTMYKYDNYQKKSDGPVPLRWMAIESIKYGIFSSQSDVWSFGIVLWEFFTVGEIPYPGMRVHKLSQMLDQGYRMEQPEYASDSVYEIMLWCWKSNPKLRPSFTQLVERFGKLLGESATTYYFELSQPYLNSNEEDFKGKKDYLQLVPPPDHVIPHPAEELIETDQTNSIRVEVSTEEIEYSNLKSTGSNLGSQTIP